MTHDVMTFTLISFQLPISNLLLIYHYTAHLGGNIWIKNVIKTSEWRFVDTSASLVLCDVKEELIAVVAGRLAEADDVIRAGRDGWVD